jgi:hypothetical protein
MLTTYSRVSERDSATQNRAQKGNALYDKVVELCNVGKHIYEDTDEAKYNDYVIIHTHAAGSQVVTGTPAPNAIHIPDVVVDDSANVIAFDNTGTVPLTIYFAADVTDMPDVGTTVNEVAAGIKKSDTAAVLGWSAGTPILLVLNKDLTTAGEFGLKVS